MNKLLIGSVLCLLLQGSAFAFDYSFSEDNSADDSSFYAGVGAGMIVAGDTKDVCTQSDISCISYKAWAGYRPNENMAFEGGYHHFLDGRSNSSTQDKIEASGLSLSVLGFMPVKDNIEAFGKLGFAAWDARVNGASAANGSDVLLGAGAQMKIDENIGLRGELEYIGGDMAAASLSAGVSYSTW